MPTTNPFVETFYVPDSPGGGGGGGGTLTGLLPRGGGVGDHHISAGAVLVAIGVLVLLFKSKFRFSSTVG